MRKVAKDSTIRIRSVDFQSLRRCGGFFLLRTYYVRKDESQPERGAQVRRHLGSRGGPCVRIALAMRHVGFSIPSLLLLMCLHF